MNYNKADFIASYGISSQLPESDRPELSFSGRSNVGKSSLINKLCSRKNLARVSSTPGKTATINFYSVDDTPCWCSCWTAATPPAPTMSRCCATCTITRSPTWWP